MLTWWLRGCKCNESFQTCALRTHESLFRKHFHSRKLIYGGGTNVPEETVLDLINSMFNSRLEFNNFPETH